jgi:dihydropteroate synthase
MPYKDTFFNKKRLIRIRGNYWDITMPKVMGILNLTPDSFFDGGRFTDPGAMMAQVGKMLAEGADFIDIGSYSSRPGADNIDLKEESERLIKALVPIRKKYPEIVLSVDTFRSEVAKIAVKDFDVDIINDISAGSLDEVMIDTIAELQVPYTIMHMRGTPQNMQQQTQYDDLIKEIIYFLGTLTNKLLHRGIKDIIIDPGFGFSKTIDQNFQILYNLDAFKIIEQPLLVGLSRKSMIYKTLETSVENSLTGTTALHMSALERGADILRVHDVKEARQAISLFLKLREQSGKYRNQ